MPFAVPVEILHINENGVRKNDSAALVYPTAACSSQARQPPARAGNRRFSAVKGPARPYKSAIQNRFTMGNAEGA